MTDPGCPMSVMFVMQPVSRWHWHSGSAHRFFVLNASPPFTFPALWINPAPYVPPGIHPAVIGCHSCICATEAGDKSSLFPENNAL